MLALISKILISLPPHNSRIEAEWLDKGSGPASRSGSRVYCVKKSVSVRRTPLPYGRQALHSCVMTDTMIEERAALPKADGWAERIAAQQRSGMSVKQFCREQGLTECSFYAWRKRLQKKEAVRFALVDRGAARQEAAVELVLATGERLRISAGVDGATLRTVLDALRA
jgi:hypothetical protein